jgi:hypothetical protein
MLTKEKFFTIPTSNTNNNRSKIHSLNNTHHNNGLCFNAVSDLSLKLCIRNETFQLMKNGTLNKNLN